VISKYVNIIYKAEAESEAQERNDLWGLEGQQKKEEFLDDGEK